MKSLLIGEAASDSDVAAIRTAVESDEAVRRLIHMRTQHIGPDELLVGAKLELAEGLTVADVATTINRVEAAVRASVPSARVIYLEPDLTRADQAVAR
jgi:divalent metal cation (Fe/Co/Zn/Cd) transporter